MMGLSKEEYEGFKANFGMWMYESFQVILHIQNYNFGKLDINKTKRCRTKFTRPEMIEMAIAIFSKRVDLELQKSGGLATMPGVELMTKIFGDGHTTSDTIKDVIADVSVGIDGQQHILTEDQKLRDEISQLKAELERIELHLQSMTDEEIPIGKEVTG